MLFASTFAIIYMLCRYVCSLISDKSQCLGKKKTVRLRIKMQAYQRLMIEGGRATCSGYQDHAEELFSGGRGSRREKFCTTKAESSKCQVFQLCHTTNNCRPPEIALLVQLQFCQQSLSVIRRNLGIAQYKIRSSSLQKTSRKPSVTLFSYCGFK